MNWAITEFKAWIGNSTQPKQQHDDVIKWKHFPRYWPFVRGIHRSPGNSRTKASDAELWWFLFDLRLSKRLSKRSWGWWFETQSRPLWRHCNEGVIFLHAKPWIPGVRKSIFMHGCHDWRRSLMRQFARARTIDEYDVTIPIPRVRVTSQIEMWWRHNAKPEKTIIGENSEMGNRWFLAGLCARSWFKIAHKKWNNVQVTVNTNFSVTREAIRNFGIHGNQYIFISYTLIYALIEHTNPLKQSPIFIHALIICVNYMFLS